MQPVDVTIAVLLVTYAAVTALPGDPRNQNVGNDNGSTNTFYVIVDHDGRLSVRPSESGKFVAKAAYTRGVNGSG